MGAFELDIGLYFWLIDRGDFEDDQRNQVDVSKQRVKLFRDHGQRLENGYYIGKIMHVIRKTIIKKSKKPFTLDPVLNSLKDQPTQSCREYNWNYVVVELRKFNIKISLTQKQQLVVDQKHSIVTDILRKLQEYDQNLLAYNPHDSVDQYTAQFDGIGSGLNNQPSFVLNGRNLSLDKKKDNNSELNFGMISKDAIEKRLPKFGDNETPLLDNQSETAPRGMGVSKSSAILMAAPQKKTLLNPLNSVVQSQSISTLPLDGKQPPSGLIQLREMERVGGNSDLDKSIAIDPNDISKIEVSNDLVDIPDDVRSSDLSEATTAVLFIMGSLKLSFGMRQNQIGGLLANNNKILVLTCIKGTKGADFSRIVNWYKLVQKNLGHLIFLLQNETDQIRQTLTVLRCGLYSKNLEVAILACRLFTKISSIVNENSQSQGMATFKLILQDWLVTAMSQGSKPPPSPIKPGKIPKSRKQADLDVILLESGLSSFLRAQLKHQHEFIQDFGQFLVQVGSDNYVDLLTHQMRLQSPSQFSYQEIMQALFALHINEQAGRKMFLDSGVINIWIDLCLQHADQTTAAPAPAGFSNGQNQVRMRIDERMISLTILADIWREVPSIIQSRPNDFRMSDAIISVLKRGCRDRSKAVSTLSMNLMCSLMEIFSRARNRFAPVIYKALTFIMVDTFQNSDLRQEMLHNFITLYRNQPTIPIQILCDPLLKQIQIQIEKQDLVDGSLLQPMAEQFFLNSTDFEFFMHIATHPKLNAHNAVQLLRIVNEISRKNIIFTRISLKLLLTVLSRFENNIQVFEFCQSDIQSCMKIIYDQDTIKREMHSRLMLNPRAKVQLKKQSVSFAYSGANTSVNQSLEILPQFSSLASKNTHNVKFKNNERNFSYLDRGSQSPVVQKNKGIINDSKYNNLEYIDDSDLQAMLNPKFHQEESARYLQMKTQEKMIVNQLQCFINTGIRVLVEYIRQQLLETYIRIEKKLKFKNKGILHLLQIFERDVPKMLQYYYKEQSKVRAEKIRARQAEREQQMALLKDTGSISRTFDESIESDYFPTIPDSRLLQSIPRRDQSPTSILNSKNISSLKKTVNPYLDSMPTSISISSKLSKAAPPQIMSLEYYEPKQLFSVKKSTSKLDRQSLDAIRLAESVDTSQFGRRELGEPVSVRAISIGRSKKEPQLKLYDPTNVPGEVESYRTWVTQYMKLYKAIFHRFSASSNIRSSLKKITFDDYQEHKNSMTLVEIFHFLNDFKILSNFPGIKREVIKRIIKLINLQKFDEAKSYNDLDLSGFIEFVLQLAYVLYDRLEKASVFLPLFFRYMKEVSFESKKPLFQRLFEDPNASSIGDPAVIRELSRKVNSDPTYKLPPGFVKFPTYQVQESYPAPGERSEAEKISLEILDDVYSSIFGNHLLFPDIKYQQQWGVKPDIFQTQKKARIRPSYMKINDKYQYQSKYTRIADDDDVSYISGKSRKSRIASSMPRISRAGSAVSSRNFDVRKSMSLKKKAPIQRMESSLDPDLDLSLKIQLAQNLLHPNRSNLKEAAVLMQDMLTAVENGQTTLAPEAKQRIYKNVRVSSRMRPKNKIMLDRLEKEQNDKMDRDWKQIKFEERQSILKKQLDQHKNQKSLVQQYELIKMREEKQRLKEQEEKRRKKKDVFYGQLQKDFEENRLPVIKETHERELELKKMQKQKRLRDKQVAEEKIQKNTQDMIAKFRQMQKEKEEEEWRKKQKEEEQKRKKERVNSQLTQNFKKRETIKKGQLERELSMDRQVPQQEAGGQRSKSVDLRKSRASSAKSSQKGGARDKSPKKAPIKEKQAESPPKKKKLFGLF